MKVRLQNVEISYASSGSIVLPLKSVSVVKSLSKEADDLRNDVRPTDKSPVLFYSSTKGNFLANLGAGWAG